MDRPPKRPPVLEIDDLSVSYATRAGEISAVTGFSLEVAPGETVGLVGESGCGKSTVAMAVMRYLGASGRIAGGTIRFLGRDMAELDPDALRAVRGGQIAMVYQEPASALNPALRIGEQLVEVPRTHASASRQDARLQALEILRDVRLPDPERVMRAYPHQLSGGQQQRVVIAMALLGRPALLLLDEPTTALDVTVEAAIVELIGGLSRRYGTALLYISHNLALMREVCDRVCVMYAGEAVEEGATGTLFAQPRHPYTIGLLDCVPSVHADRRKRPLKAIPGRLPQPQERPAGCGFGPRCLAFDASRCGNGAIPLHPVEGDMHVARCARLDDMEPLDTVAGSDDRPADTPGGTILDIEGLTKTYSEKDGSLRALVTGKSVRLIHANEDIDLDARVGETVAIVGESGCGKSTLARVVMGLETSDGGSVRFRGAEIGNRPAGRRTPGQHAALQMVFQNPHDTLNPTLSVGAQIGRVVMRFGVATGRAGVGERVRRLLEMVNLPADFAARRPRQLSGGQKQRVAIARAFAGNPDLVVADEPISALDVSVAASILALIDDIRRTNRTTLLFISHDLGAVHYLADRVVVMYAGRVMERGTADEIFAPPYHPYTEALLSAAPIADPNLAKRRIVLEGAPPGGFEALRGCPFSARCPRRIGEICDSEAPPVRKLNETHTIACHLPARDLDAVEPVIFERRAADG